MSRPANLAMGAMHSGFLGIASLIVPSRERGEWHREWACELYHARLECMPDGVVTWMAACELTSFCFGSFRDALCVRSMRSEAPAPSASVHGSARQCMLWLGTVLALCTLIARFLPGVQSEDDAARVRLHSGLMLIQRVQDDDHPSASISFEDFRDWNSRRQQFFTSLAFYRTEQLPPDGGGSVQRSLVIAHASENLFDVLGIQVEPDNAAAQDTRVPDAILSQSMWRRTFASDPAILNRVISVSGRNLRIAAIAPGGAWRLPENPDIWILEPESKLANESRGTYGFVVAQLSATGEMQMAGNATPISTFDQTGDPIELRGISVAAPAYGTVSIYCFALFLALLALPAVTSVFSSESSFASHRPSLRVRVKCWVFLAGKCGLIAAVGYFGALDIAYAGSPEYSPSAEFLQIVATFNLCLFGFRWALVDQSRRCPVCLRRVTHPAQVGIASCSFLGWNGTEMICMGGHALLHVPNLPTSWFSRQRWMYLDTSWDFLFADAVGRS